MHFFISYDGSPDRGSGCPAWCDVSFPTHDAAPIEGGFRSMSQEETEKFRESDVFFYYAPIGFDFFDQYKDAIFCSSLFVEVLRDFNVDFSSVPINAHMIGKNKKPIKIEKKYHLAVFHENISCADFSHSELRVERDEAGKVVFGNLGAKRPKLKYLYRLVVDEKLAGNSNLFRVAERMDLLVVSENLFLELRKRDFKGIKLTPTPDADLMDLPSFRGDKRIIDHGVDEIFFPNDKIIRNPKLP